ncbi:unnamed protein product [Absidia cylindrospora]
MILDGWFFQPLGCLIDSAIIKILGDYKLLYESERRWGKLSLGITALGIGCFLDDDHDFDTLMGTVVIGCAAQFLLSLSTTVQPADPVLLGVQSDEHFMEISPLLSKPSLSPQYYVDDHINPHQPQRLYIHHHHHHHHHHHITDRRNSHDEQASHLYNESIHADENIATTETSPLFESATTSPYYYSSYKPYSLFGDHLSHISEEDISMLQQIPSTPPRAPSVLSNKTNKTNSMDYLLDNSTFQFTPISYCMPQPPTPLQSDSSDGGYSSTMAHSSSLSPLSPQSPRSPLPPSHYNSIDRSDGIYINNNSTTSDSITATPSLSDTTFMSMSLALLPFPPGDIPMIVLISIFPRFRPDSFHSALAPLSPPSRHHHPQLPQLQHQHQQQVQIRQSIDLESNAQCQGNSKDDVEDNENHMEQSYLLIMSNCFILGLVYAPMILWAPLVYYDYFNLPMHTVGLMILIGCLSDMVISHYAPLTLERFPLRNCALVAHLILMMCIFVYLWLPSGQEQHWWSLFCLFILHVTQSSTIQMIWLTASCQVDLLYLASCQDRMMLRGKMSALYSSFGPAFGSLLMGWLVTLGWSFQSVYFFTLLLIPFSASLTLGWC